MRAAQDTAADRARHRRGGRCAGDERRVVARAKTRVGRRGPS
jgi:hypothetical protein